MSSIPQHPRAQDPGSTAAPAAPAQQLVPLPRRPVTAQSADGWNNLLADIFGSIRAEPRLRTGFEASLVAVSVGDVDMIRCQSGAANVYHDPRDMPRGLKNDFIIKVQMNGESRIRLTNNELHLRPGDYMICDNSQPYCLSFEQETTIISVPLAESYLRRFSPFPADVAFMPVGGANPIHRVAFDYLHSLWRNDVDTLSTFARARLADTFLELAVLSIADEQRLLAPPRTGHSDLYLRCCRYIDAHFSDEELTSAQIAAANGVSLRLLQATFAEQGTTVRDYVTARRLQEAARILESPVYGARSISEIAYRAGFKSLASFSRTFKDYFGRSPKEFRAHRTDV